MITAQKQRPIGMHCDGNKRIRFGKLHVPIGLPRSRKEIVGVGKVDKKCAAFLPPLQPCICRRIEERGLKPLLRRHPIAVIVRDRSRNPELVNHQIHGVQPDEIDYGVGIRMPAAELPRRLQIRRIKWKFPRTEWLLA